MTDHLAGSEEHLLQALEHLRAFRASQPATEDHRVIDGKCVTCSVVGPQPVEGVSDEEIGRIVCRTQRDGDFIDHATARDIYNFGASRSSAAKDARIAELEALLVAVHAAINNRTPHGPKENARCTIEWIEDAKETISELRAEVATERERCARVCEEEAANASAASLPGHALVLEDTARRIREEPEK